MKLKLKTKSLNDTQKIATAFAKMLTPPMIVLFVPYGTYFAIVEKTY